MANATKKGEQSFGTGKRGMSLPWQHTKPNKQGQRRSRWHTVHFPMPKGWHGKLMRCPDCGGRTMISVLTYNEYPATGHSILEKARTCDKCDGTGVVPITRRERLAGKTEGA